MSILDTFHGQINDLDSHEMTPTTLWHSDFGGDPAAEEVIDKLASVFAGSVQDTFTENAASITADATVVTEDNVWRLKGVAAPGSFSPERRVEVLDFMGVDTQLVFPGGIGLIATLTSVATTDTFAYMIGADPAEVASWDLKRLALGLARAHNDWAIRYGSVNPRLRPVGVLCTYDLDAAINEAERIIDAGIKAVTIPSSLPPDGKSPAHPDIDPLWRLFEESGVAVTLHIGGEFEFTKSTEWRNIPQFQRSAPEGLQEVPIDAYTLSTAHLGPQNFLSTIILGGVFDRFPNLRFGVIELGASWIGAMAENLDLWHAMFRKKLALSMEPSKFVERNLRVTPFYFEPVDRYIERYGLADVYCYASDFPHIEGGTSPMRDHAERLERLGPDLMRKFFVDNARWLLPGA